MRSINISETRKHLPRLISEIIASREEVMITRHGRPVAKLLVCTPNEEQDDLYPLRDLHFHVEGDFDEPLLNMWEALQG